MTRWREWLPVVGLSALMVIETFFDLRRAPTPSPWLWNSYLIVYLLAALACLVFAVPAIRQAPARHFSRAGRVIMGSATALMIYSLISSAVAPRPRVSYIYVPRAYLLAPTLTALATLLLAFAVVRILPTRPAHQVLWWPAVLTVACSFLQWPRSALVHHSPRLATGMGGSAVVHVPLLLATGIIMAAFLAGWHRWWSLGLSIVGVASVVLTGSRSGVACLVLAGVIVALQWLRSRRAWLVAGAVAVVTGVLVAAVPMLHRLLNPTDELRAQNLETAMAVWTSTGKHVLLGIGSGRLWPWYAFDSHLLRTPWRGMVTTAWGPALNSSHSTFLQVLVELGLDRKSTRLNSRWWSSRSWSWPDGSGRAFDGRPARYPTSCPSSPLRRRSRPSSWTPSCSRTTGPACGGGWCCCAAAGGLSPRRAPRSRRRGRPRPGRILSPSCGGRWCRPRRSCPGRAQRARPAPRSPARR